MFGASRSLRGILHEFERMRISYKLATMTRGALAENFGHAHCKELISAGERIWFTAKYKAARMLRLAYETTLLLTRIRHFLIKNRAQLAYINTLEFGTPILGSLLAGVPCVVHMRESEEYARARDPVARLRLWIIRKVQPRFIVVSKAAGQTARQIGIPPSHIRVAYNAVDTNHFRPRPNRPNPAGPTVVCVTRISREKGVDDLLLAAPRIIENFPNARFLLVGGPLDSRYFNDVIKPLHRAGNLAANWTFAGMVDDPREALASADLVVIPSRHETFGRVNIEAMAMGKAVVATDAGGIPEVVQHGVNGIIVPRQEPEHLADGIISLLEDPDRRRAMGLAGRQLAVTKFSQANHAERVLALLRDAAEGRW